MRKKIFYEYIIQEQEGEFWLDRYISTDRYFVEQCLKVFKSKYNSKFRVVRLVL